MSATSELTKYDVCDCGDYRLQHDARGCRVCRAGRQPWDKCDGFSLFIKAEEIPEPYKSNSSSPQDQAMTALLVLRGAKWEFLLPKTAKDLYERERRAT